MYPIGAKQRVMMMEATRAMCHSQKTTPHDSVEAGKRDEKDSGRGVEQARASKQNSGSDA